MKQSSEEDDKLVDCSSSFSSSSLLVEHQHVVKNLYYSSKQQKNEQDHSKSPILVQTSKLVDTYDDDVEEEIKKLKELENDFAKEMQHADSTPNRIK